MSDDMYGWKIAKELEQIRRLLVLGTPERKRQREEYEAEERKWELIRENMRRNPPKPQRPQRVRKMSV